MTSRTFIYNLIQEKHSLEVSHQSDNINFIEEGYVDSLSLLQFIIKIEEKFDVRFTPEELSSTEFQTIGSLIEMIDDKMNK